MYMAEVILVTYPRLLFYGYTDSNFYIRTSFFSRNEGEQHRLYMPICRYRLRRYQIGTVNSRYLFDKILSGLYFLGVV